MVVDNYITLAENQCFRDPAEFVFWFSNKLDQINSGENVREQILLRKGIAKIVFEEIFPLYRLLQIKRREWTGTKFRNVIGNQSFDVETTSEVQSIPRFMEITVADANYEEHLRMRYFAEHGHVSVVGKVSYEGTQNTGLKISVPVECESHIEIIDRKQSMIREAVSLKCGKFYQHDTALLVYFDDYVAFRDAHDADTMTTFVVSLGDEWMHTFSHLFIVGATGSNLWARKRGEKVLHSTSHS